MTTQDPSIPVTLSVIEAYAIKMVGITVDAQNARKLAEDQLRSLGHDDDAIKHLLDNELKDVLRQVRHAMPTSGDKQ